MIQQVIQQTHSERTANDAKTNKDKKVKKDKKNNKNKYLEFVKLSDEEYEKLVEQFTENGAKSRIENLNLYIGSKGDKYKSHYHTILSWERKNNKNNKAQNNANSDIKNKIYNIIKNEVPLWALPYDWKDKRNLITIHGKINDRDMFKNVNIDFELIQNIFEEVKNN